MVHLARHIIHESLGWFVLQMFEVLVVGWLLGFLVGRGRHRR